MKKRTVVLLALLGLTLILEACDLMSHGKEGANKDIPPATEQTQVNTSSLPSAPQAGTEGVEGTAQASQSATGSAAAESYIGETKAFEIALSHAGITTGDLLFSKIHLDRDDGRVIYDVEFYAGNKEYDYEIDAITGNILGFDSDMENDYIPQTPTSDTQTDSKNTTATTEQKQQTANTQPKQQSVPVQEQQQQSTPAPQQQQQPAPTQQQQQQPTSSGVSIETAKQTALAKVPGADSSHIRIHQDYDDGRLVYEGKIIYNQMEYEFEIDAASGTITDWDSESIYD